MLVSGAAAGKPLQSCLTLCDPHRWQPTGLHCPWDSPGKNTGMGCYFLLHLSGEVFAKRTFLPITPLPMSQSLPPMQTWVPVLYGCGGWTCFFSPASYLPRWAGGLQLRTGKINKPSELSLTWLCVPLSIYFPGDTVWLWTQNVEKGFMELLTLSPLSPSPVVWISPGEVRGRRSFLNPTLGHGVCRTLGLPWGVPPSSLL